MQRVLIITFCYPPTSLIGAVRPAALAKYLPRFGWTPLVLTPKVSEVGRQSDGIWETDYDDVVATWKARIGLDGQRGIHDQFQLQVSSTPGRELLHTRLLDLAKYLITYP